ncbi:GFA family protein [Salinisphaera sp. S4-8]|uniref:GFA family protein n=1 Tax=Salinisphaera sp. S4-8 TaxID=633357 RepID=UPI00333FBBF9
MTEFRKATCHCGSVELEIQFDNGLENLRRCDCSLCSRKGYVMASVPTIHVTLVKGEDVLSVYRWGTRVAEHFFCSLCGVYTHHKRRSNPSEYGLNIACIEGVNALAFDPVPIGNGHMNRALPPV